MRPDVSIGHVIPINRGTIIIEMTHVRFSMKIVWGMSFDSMECVSEEENCAVIQRTSQAIHLLILAHGMTDWHSGTHWMVTVSVHLSSLQQVRPCRDLCVDLAIPSQCDDLARHP